MNSQCNGGLQNLHLSQGLHMKKTPCDTYFVIKAFIGDEVYHVKYLARVPWKVVPTGISLFSSLWCCGTRKPLLIWHSILATVLVRFPCDPVIINWFVNKAQILAPQNLPVLSLVFFGQIPSQTLQSSDIAHDLNFLAKQACVEIRSEHDINVMIHK